ncbi:MAG: sulfide-dependent adenosine diphosphate thiazole synthase [Nitrospirota bacterium]
MIEEKEISNAIVNSFFKRFKDSLSCDVIIVGGGPSGLVCGYFLAKKGIKTVLCERRGSLGGGIWGGGMLFNSIVVQKSVKRLLDEFGIRYELEKDYLIATAPEFTSAIILSVCRAGVEIFNFISAEDVTVKSGRVCGLVMNWTPVEMAGLHVDPLTIEAKYVVDATGHDHAVSKILIEKLKVKNKKNYYMSEKPMNAELGEREVVQNSKEIFPGLYVSGMAANAVFGGHRMGPIFGGMILSGEKVAKSIIKQLEGKKK